MFCICSSFGPPRQNNNNKQKHVAPHLECHVSVDRVKIGIGAKAATNAKLRGAIL